MTSSDNDRTPEMQVCGPSEPSFNRQVQRRCCRQPRASAVRLPRTSLVGSGQQAWPWAGAQSGYGFPDFQTRHSHPSRGSPPLPLSKACWAINNGQSMYGKYFMPCPIKWYSFEVWVFLRLSAKKWVRHERERMEEGMATHSSILTWKIPWTEEPGGLQSTGSQSQTQLSNFTWVKTST